MPLFVYIGRDGPDGARLRPDARPQHLAHLEVLEAQERIRFAGPLLDPSGSPCGSVVVLEAQDEAAAREIAEGDPYLRLGVFESIELHGTKQVLPKAGAGDGA